MARRKMSEEARKAASERMKAMHAKKKAEKENTYQEPEPQQTREEHISYDDYEKLKNQVEELKANQPLIELLTKALGNGPQATVKGMVGTIEKYSVNPNDYPDPRERLAEESKLEIHAFKLNYELGWKIEVSSYETIDKQRMKEPRFTLELIKIVRDEETGSDTGDRFVICKAIFHEDPDAAIAIANEQNLPIDESNEKAFLDEMRYLRMRDWLLEAFYPPKRTDISNKKEMVIGNQLVEVYSLNSEQPKSIPFNELKKAKF